MKENKKAFTLIELLVVVLIIGILAAIALPQYQKAVEKAYMAEAIIQVRALGQAEQAYYLANGKYAATFDDLDISIAGTPNETPATVISQKNFDFTLIPYQQHLFAKFTKNPTGTWYIAYDLTNSKLYCTAYKTSRHGNSICKTVGSTPIDCRWNTPEWCYLIQ